MALTHGYCSAANMSAADSVQNQPPPNVILLFCDDLGYGDIEPFGAQHQKTPNLLKMASQGIKLTDFYVSSGVCSPSRASLMTGSYPRRVDMHMNEKPRYKSQSRQVIFPIAIKGLNPQEETIADLLKSNGYRTAMVGKWHLGDQPEVMPNKQGFDYFFGLPYSNDMLEGLEDYPPLPLMVNDKVIEAPVEQDSLTRRYTKESLRFIRENQSNPFFLYVAYNMPHNPVHASDEFKGSSQNNLYGDAIQELDWSVGEIQKLLEELNLDENTLLIFTSDNGAAKPYGGLNAPLSGFKGSVEEGGMRVPALIQWKGHIPANSVSKELTSTMDLLPTISKLTGSPQPREKIDGKDISSILFQEGGAHSPHEAFFYYQVDQLQAVRSGEWKLYLPLANKRGLVETNLGPSKARLYRLGTDMREMNELSEKYPEKVQELLDLADQARSTLGDGDQWGPEQRKAYYTSSPKAIRKD